MPARVVRISLAPVKGLGLTHPEEVELGPLGVAGNRRFWLRDATGRHANQKSHPQLGQIRVEWDEDTRELVLTFRDGTRLAGVVDPDAPIEAVLYRHPHPSRTVHGPWQEAISEVAGEPLELLWSDDGAPDRLHAGTATILSLASVARLARQAGAESLDTRRFRMLFEIDGVDAHEEDTWIGREVRVGEATVKVHGDVGRCAVTTRNPDTGDVDVNTLKALADYRREGVTERLPLGVYGSVVVPGRVGVGDDIAPGLY